MNPDKEMFKLDPEELAKYNSSSSNEQEKIQYFEKKFAEWINRINSFLNDDQD